MIPVEHARAKDIADVLRQVYADRLVVSPRISSRAGRGGFLPGHDGGNGRRRSWRRPGGFGGPPAAAGQGGQNQRDNANRISIGVDTRTNNLVVSATDPVVRRGQAVGPATRRGGGLAKRNGAGGHPASHQRGSRAKGPGGLRRRRRAKQSPRPTTNAANGNNNATLRRSRGGPTAVSARRIARRATVDGRRRAVRRQFFAFPRWFRPALAILSAGRPRAMTGLF